MHEAVQLAYAAVTPARDEQENLPRLAELLAAQSVRPVRWIIVENGSNDHTLEVANGLARAYPWIEVIQMEVSHTYRRITAELAFQVGVDALRGAGDLVTKLDADVSFEPDFFEGMLGAFASEPALGIASGTLLMEVDGDWQELVCLADHCHGQTRTYRRACLEQVLPLDAGECFTWVDETKAHLGGFTTRSLRQLPFRHLRPEGEGEGSRWTHWRGQGVGSHYLRYRPSYLIVRWAYQQLMGEKAAFALFVGYLDAVRRRAPRYEDERLLDAVREQQRLRHLAGLLRDHLRWRSDPNVTDTPADVGALARGAAPGRNCI